MSYLIATLTAVAGILFGLWQKAASEVKAVRRSLTSTDEAFARYALDRKADEDRHAAEVAALKTELAATRKELDALSTPSSVRDDVARLLAR